MCASNFSPTKSTTDKLAAGGENRTSQIVTTILAANTTFPVFQTGAEFYLIVATGLVYIKPNNGSEAQYVQGTGLKVDENNIFKSLQIRNDNAFPVVMQMFVGFGGYIDNRLIVYDPSVIQAPYSTSGTVNTANQILIPDLSGQAIVGMNGEHFLALNRVSVYISNASPADAYDLFNTAQTKSIITVQPLTSIVFPANGNFSMKVPSGNINAIVSEIYNVIRPT